MTNKFIKVVLTFLISNIISFSGCSEKTALKSGLLDSNGLSRDINDMVADSLLQIIKSFGMPVNTGDSPPDIEGAYVFSPFVLDSTNIPNDWPAGFIFADYLINFTDQNNSDLSVNIDYVNATITGKGIGSFIVGNASDFSVFSRMITYNPTQTDSAYVLYLFSGSKQSNALRDIYVAAFMLDDLGDPSDYFIENGQGRIIYDQDGLSEPTVWNLTKQSTFIPTEDSKISVLKQR